MEESKMSIEKMNLSLLALVVTSSAEQPRQDDARGKVRICNIGFGVASILIATLIVVGVSGCSEKVPEGFVGSGTLEAKEVTLSAETSGTVLKLTRDEGETVSKGDTLCLLDVEKLRLKKNEVEAGMNELTANKAAFEEEAVQAEVNLNNVQKRYDRIGGLFKKGSATQQQFDDALTALTIAKSRLKLAKAKLEALDAQKHKIASSIELLDARIADGAITSPIDAVVEERYTEVGEFARVGMPIYKLVDTSRFWLRVYISGRELGSVAIGDTVTVKVDSVSRSLIGVISSVSSEAEFTPKNVQTRDSRAELVYAAKVRLLKGGKTLKIGMPAEVYIR
ncbi:hypothetical protein DRQ05_01960 [bacterium]|nr:MAG: hypothetical protein DRQ05_01960 [bacterium]